MTEFESMVEQLVTLGFPRDKAEAQVRSQKPHLAPALVEETNRENVLEKVEQAEVTKIFRAHGCTVYSLSQSRATKQTPGLADLWVVSRRAGVAFWFETKRMSGGRHSSAQLEFADDCRACNVGYYTGDRSVAWTIVRSIGLADRGTHSEEQRA